jgi:hypothetical protein
MPWKICNVGQRKSVYLLSMSSACFISHLVGTDGQVNKCDRDSKVLGGDSDGGVVDAGGEGRDDGCKRCSENYDDLYLLWQCEIWGLINMYTWDALDNIFFVLLGVCGSCYCHTRQKWGFGAEKARWL